MSPDTQAFVAACLDVTLLTGKLYYWQRNSTIISAFDTNCKVTLRLKQPQLHR